MNEDDDVMRYEDDAETFELNQLANDHEEVDDVEDDAIDLGDGDREIDFDGPEPFDE